MKKPNASAAGNTEKDPDDWVSGEEPMTGAQASYLKTLCEQAHSDAFDENLAKAQASKLIDEMREKEAGSSKYESEHRSKRNLHRTERKEAAGRTAQQEREGKSHVGARQSDGHTR
jgi:hypothetical protein